MQRDISYVPQMRMYGPTGTPANSDPGRPFAAAHEPDQHRPSPVALQYAIPIRHRDQADAGDAPAEMMNAWEMAQQVCVGFLARMHERAVAMLPEQWNIRVRFSAECHGDRSGREMAVYAFSPDLHDLAIAGFGKTLDEAVAALVARARSGQVSTLWAEQYEAWQLSRRATRARAMELIGTAPTKLTGALLDAVNNHQTDRDADEAAEELEAARCTEILRVSHDVDG
jgi:hypothetical protein